MKMKNGYNCTVIVFILVILLGPIPRVNGDIGGGSGEAITPYNPEKPIKPEEVEKVKDISNRTRFVEDLKLKDTNITQYGEQVGLIYAEGQNVTGQPFFKFKGVTESRTQVEIDFSEVKSFSLLKVRNRWFFGTDEAFLEVVRFPAISPGELLAKKPSYSALVREYTERLRLWITLEQDGELCLVGKERSEEDQYRILSPLREIESSSEVVLKYGIHFINVGSTKTPIQAIWWATDSVIKDPQYPHKRYQER